MCKFWFLIFILALWPVFLFGEGLLSSVCTADYLNKNLIEPMSFSPVPHYGDKYWCDSIPEEMRKSYISEGEKYLDVKWESVDISLFSEFSSNGDRSRYQTFSFNKRKKLGALALAEIMEGKGRFMPDILNGMYSLCEETWWGIPAHYGWNVPLPDIQTLDLFNAETGGMISWMYYMFKEPIRKFSPSLEKRIQMEISRRITLEAKNKREWWRGASMNWNPWICSNWLACILFVEPDREKQIDYVKMVLESLDGFIGKYPDDGGCDEGAHYWDRAAGSLFDCLNIMKKATSGKLDFSSNKKLRLMGDFLCKMNIGNGYFVNFADAASKLSLHVDWFPSAFYFNNRELMSLSANTAENKDLFHNPSSIFMNNGFGSINRELVLLSVINDLKRIDGDDVLLYDSWLPRIQVMTARTLPNSTDGFYLAAKGGHNAESHNHNDVGSFIVYADGNPLFIDPGTETYRKETFNNATRYKIWCMRSGYHNLPIINGVEQENGKKYAADCVKSDICRNSVLFSLDISSAYPQNSEVESWVREIYFRRGKHIKVTEKYVLHDYVKPSELIFMTLIKPVLLDGVLSFFSGGNEYQLLYDKKELIASYEEIEMKDSKLRNEWGERLYRIKLAILSKELKGKVSYVIRKL